MAVLNVATCTCPASFDVVVCAKCGGRLLPPSQAFSKIDMSVQQWFYDLDSESRLNSTLGTYVAIDRQIRQGVPLTAVVQEAAKKIGSELSSLREEIEHRLTERFNELRGGSERSTKLLREVVIQQVESMIGEVKTLSEQGKSIAGIESRIREATGALQTYLAVVRLPGVRGEESEINVVQGLHDAFLGQSRIRIEPVGGADATDAIVKFFCGDIEISRSLVEIKSRKTWSNEYLDQVRSDERRYNAAFALLVVDKLPKSAKARGFHVDTQVGIVVTAPPDLVVPAVTMFYEVHAASYALQKRAIALESMAADKGLAHYISDNMKILDDCRKILDLIDDAAGRVKEHVANISSRLQENNRKIAQILTNLGGLEAG